MKEELKLPPNNIQGPENVNIPPEEIERAEALALDDATIWALTDIIFSQKDRTAPPS